MRIGICQFEVVPNLSSNLQVITRLTQEAVAGGAELVVLPEASIWPISAAAGELTKVADAVEDDVIPALTGLAREAEVTLVAGLLEPSPTLGRVSNTIRVFASDGDALGAYRKIHLYDAFGARESDRYQEGPLEPFVFTTGEFAMGVMTCYDLRFPELGRALVDRGAEVLLVPAAWAQGALKEDHWNILLRARAIENTCYVVAAAQSGGAYAARSAVIDPLGVAIAALAEGDGVAVADLSRPRLEDIRVRVPVLANRRLPRVDLDSAVPTTLTSGS
jgi:predicted amidohydrolase